MSIHDAAENGTMTLQALERAILEAFPILFNRIKRRYGDPQLAEEVAWDSLSQAFVKWKEDPEYFTRRDLTSWCSIRANWRALDRLRARNRHSPLPDEHPHGDDRPAVVADRSPETDHVLADRLATWEALGQLDELDRKILIGHYYDRRSDQDLGTELFGETGTLTARGLRVWRIRQKAQARLRDLLLADGIGPEDYAGQAV